MTAHGPSGAGEPIRPWKATRDERGGGNPASPGRGYGNLPGDGCAAGALSLIAGQSADRTAQDEGDTAPFLSLPDGSGRSEVGLGQCPSALGRGADRKSTRLNSSYVKISYAVFC